MNGATEQLDIAEPPESPAVSRWQGLALRMGPTVRAGTDIRACAAAMASAGHGSLLVLEDESPRPLGLLGLPAIFAALAQDPLGTARAGKLAESCSNLLCTPEDVPAALSEMQRRGVSRLVLVNAEGYFAGWMDRSDLLNAECQRLRAQARQADEVLDDMRDEIESIRKENAEIMCILAHDLRGPLGCVLSAAQMLADEKRRVPEGQIHTFGRIIHQEVRHLLELTKDVMTLAQHSIGRVRLNLESIEPAELVLRAAQLYAPMAERKGIGFHVRTPEGGPAAICVDGERMHTVLSNLLDNAVKYSGKGERVTIGIENYPQAICFVVADTGQGLPKEEQAKLFVRFSKGSSRPTAGEPSTGLGLAITKEIVQAHGGKITVTGDRGQGLVFRVLLPVHGRMAGSVV